MKSILIILFLFSVSHAAQADICKLEPVAAYTHDDGFSGPIYNEKKLISANDLNSEVEVGSSQKCFEAAIQRAKEISSTE